MKTVKDIENEISDLSAEIKLREKAKDKESIAIRKRLRARIPQLKQYALYLSTNPTQEYCEKEVARLSNRISEISKLYVPPEQPERFTKGQLSAMKKAFEKSWDVSKIRRQLMAISYILK